MMANQTKGVLTLQEVFVGVSIFCMHELVARVAEDLDTELSNPDWDDDLVDYLTTYNLILRTEIENRGKVKRHMEIPN